MRHVRFVLAGLVLLFCAGLSLAADFTLGVAKGTVVTANSSTVIIRPRNAEGQFGRAITMKVHGTTKITSLSSRRQGGKVVLVQNEIEPKAVRKNQVIAVVYTTNGSEAVLLSAVVEPGGSR